MFGGGQSLSGEPGVGGWGEREIFASSSLALLPKAQVSKLQLRTASANHLPSFGVCSRLITCQAELLLGLQLHLLEVGGAQAQSHHTYCYQAWGCSLSPLANRRNFPFCSCASPLITCPSAPWVRGGGGGAPRRLPIQAVIGIPVLWALVNGGIGKHLQRTLGEDQVLLLLAWVQS